MDGCTGIRPLAPPAILPEKMVHAPVLASLPAPLAHESESAYPAPAMAHNSGARPERMKVMALTAREDAARTAQALAIVAQWNAELGAGKLPQFSPTLEASFRARRPWLNIFCGGCQQQHEIDLRRIVRPKDFPIMALRAALVCERCRGGLEPRLLSLEVHPYDRGRGMASES
jgi:hypothetical protein